MFQDRLMGLPSFIMYGGVAGSRSIAGSGVGCPYRRKL
jgi:hypothetical protein